MSVPHWQPAPMLPVPLATLSQCNTWLSSPTPASIQSPNTVNITPQLQTPVQSFERQARPTHCRCCVSRVHVFALISPGWQLGCLRLINTHTITARPRGVPAVSNRRTGGLGCRTPLAALPACRSRKYCACACCCSSPQSNRQPRQPQLTCCGTRCNGGACTVPGSAASGKHQAEALAEDCCWLAVWHPYQPVTGSCRQQVPAGMLPSGGLLLVRTTAAVARITSHAIRAFLRATETSFRSTKRRVCGSF